MVTLFLNVYFYKLIYIHISFDEIKLVTSEIGFLIFNFGFIMYKIFNKQLRVTYFRVCSIYFVCLLVAMTDIGHYRTIFIIDLVVLIIK